MDQIVLPPSLRGPKLSHLACQLSPTTSLQDKATRVGNLVLSSGDDGSLPGGQQRVVLGRQNFLFPLSDSVFMGQR